jgi:hypothetical protein
MRNSLSIQSLPAIISLALLLASCGGDHQKDNPNAGPALFEKVAPAASGIDFINQISIQRISTTSTLRTST